jgi:hypothetical protein
VNAHFLDATHCRLHASMRGLPEPDAEPSPEPDMEALTDLVERAINGVGPPGYAEVPDSGALITS